MPQYMFSAQQPIQSRQSAVVAFYLFILRAADVLLVLNRISVSLSFSTLQQTHY